MVRANRRDGFGFGGATVLVGWRGDQVSCYTTVGVAVRMYSSSNGTMVKQRLSLANSFSAVPKTLVLFAS